MHEGQDTRPAHFISAPLHGLVGTDRWGLNSKLSGRPMAPRGGAAQWGEDARRDEWCLNQCCSQCHIIQCELAEGRSRSVQTTYSVYEGWGLCVCVGGEVTLKAPLCFFAIKSVTLLPYRRLEVMAEKICSLIGWLTLTFIYWTSFFLIHTVLNFVVDPQRTQVGGDFCQYLLCQLMHVTLYNNQEYDALMLNCTFYSPVQQLGTKPSEQH